MISTVELKIGSGPSSPPLSIPAAPVTVFVGPNSSGKSKVLAEIEAFCRTGDTNSPSVILKDVVFSGLKSEAALVAIERLKQDPPPGESIQVDHILVGSRHGRNEIHPNKLLRTVQSPADNIQNFCNCFLRHTTLILNGIAAKLIPPPDKCINLKH